MARAKVNGGRRRLDYRVAPVQILENGISRFIPSGEISDASHQQTMESFGDDLDVGCGSGRWSRHLAPKSRVFKAILEAANLLRRYFALDRFGTPVEQRFSRAQCERLVRAADLLDIKFKESESYWCMVGTRPLAIN